MIDVYLDVDGVVLPVIDPEVGPDVERSGWDDWAPTRKGRTNEMYSPAMVARLNVLAAREDVAMHWCTTWRERADTVLAVDVGLTRGWNVVDADMVWDRRESANRTIRSWWKRDAIAAHHDAHPDHRVVWIDDDLHFDDDAVAWVRARASRVLGISPDTATGLAAREMDRIERFVLRGR